MKIDDYYPGTAFIILYRRNFKEEEEFEALLKFLKLPLDYDHIYIRVSEGGASGR
jgi:hypothetical protein